MKHGNSARTFLIAGCAFRREITDSECLSMFARALLGKKTLLSSNMVYDIVSGECVHSRTWTFRDLQDVINPQR